MMVVVAESMKNRERRRLCRSVVAWKHGIYCYMVGNVPRDPIVHNEVSLYELVRFIHFLYKLGREWA